MFRPLQYVLLPNVVLDLQSKDCGRHIIATNTKVRGKPGDQKQSYDLGGVALNRFHAGMYIGD